MDEALLLVLTL